MAQIILGLAGKKEAGKSTAARYLRERHGFAGSNLTDPMDEMLTPLLRRMNVPEHEILPRLSGNMKEVPIPDFPWLSGRKLKQALGREFRDAISKPLPEGGTDRAFFHDLWLSDNRHHERLIHEQVRYPHENTLLQRDGARTYMVIDPDQKDEDSHESEVMDFETNGKIINKKTGLAPLHERLDQIVGELPSPVITHSGDNEPLATFDADIDTALNEHGDEIRAIADRIDGGDQELSDVLDDIADDIKGHLGTRAANTAADDQAEYAIEAAERWVADNVSNSTSDRRVAAAYALMGVEQARDRLGGGQ